MMNACHYTKYVVTHHHAGYLKPCGFHDRTKPLEAEVLTHDTAAGLFQQERPSTSNCQGEEENTPESNRLFSCMDAPFYITSTSGPKHNWHYTANNFTCKKKQAMFKKNHIMMQFMVIEKGIGKEPRHHLVGSHHIALWGISLWVQHWTTASVAVHSNPTAAYNAPDWCEVRLRAAQNEMDIHPWQDQS